MFKLPGLPSPQADPHELADFAELLAIKKGSASARQIVSYLGMIGDEEENEGCEDAESVNIDALDEVMNEIDRRREACGEGYPFTLEYNGSVLRFSPNLESPRTSIYIYLLFSTRLNMKSHRTHADIDGSTLLEVISAKVLQSYIGDKRARSLVFGTAAPGNFIDKINRLCHELREGTGFRNLDPDAAVDANDDKLDVVAWVPFSDQKGNQLVIFGQCKTGTSWLTTITQLQPDAFIKRWFQTPLIIDPIRALCLSESTNRINWCGTGVYSGLLLDRCRLTDFSENIEPEFLATVATWNAAACESIDLR